MIGRESFLRSALILSFIAYLHSRSRLQVAYERARFKHVTSSHCNAVQLHEDLLVERRFKIDCDRVVKDDQAEIALASLKRLQAKAIRVGTSNSLTEEAIYDKIVDNSCASFISERRYITDTLSQEEEKFPLAYSIVVHKDAGQVERLLRAIYRPQNSYCIHIDVKATTNFFLALQNLADCFPNVFVSKKREDVIYTHFSRLQADLNCMEVLLEKNRKWKYFINLCGQDFPLRTNAQMIKYLSYMYPQNSIESFIMPEHKKARYRSVFEIGNTAKGEYSKGLKRTEKRKESPPVKMDLYAGSAYFVATREFVEWALKNSTAQSIIDWSRDTYSPDEMLWATLTRLSGSPGFLHPNIKWDKNEFQVITRIVKWHSLEEGAPIATPKSYPKCHGYHKRGICVYGLGDIGWLLQRDQFFANKFDADSPYGDDFAIQCLEKELRKRERADVCS